MRPFPDPSILLHPQIPKPLHLMTPRAILGKMWWDEVRMEAYRRHELHCHACGVLKYDAHYRQWLEAHEMYDVDYVTGAVVFVEIVALCHFCHNYIHRGRLERLLDSREVDPKLCASIIRHGDRVLTKAGLPLDSNKQLIRFLHEQDVLCRWEDYHMIVNGVNHGQRFKSHEEWESYWQSQS